MEQLRSSSSPENYQHNIGCSSSGDTQRRCPPLPRYWPFCVRLLRVEFVELIFLFRKPVIEDSGPRCGQHQQSYRAATDARHLAPAAILDGVCESPLLIGVDSSTTDRRCVPSRDLGQRPRLANWDSRMPWISGASAPCTPASR